MEGILSLKRDYGGWRHYIVLPDGTQQDIHCGAPLAAQFESGWLSGRYECSNLGPDWDREEVKPRLVVELIPGVVVELFLQLGGIVRKGVTK